jgi:hypothetical protein
VLTEDEEDDDDYCTAQDALAHLHKYGKPMRHVGKRVMQTGKRCLDHFNNVLEEEHKEEKALKKARTEYHATMDNLHGRFASEIKAREDALADASASAAQKDKQVTDANAEIARLQGAILQQQNDAANALARAQADAATDKAAALAAQAQVAPPPSLEAEDSLNKIIADVTKHMKDKLTGTTAAAAPPPPTVPKPVKMTWIKQTNSNPSYLTVREIRYTSKRWYFDSSSKHQDPSAADNMVEMTDATIVAALQTLGSFSAVRKAFKPKVGNKCTYSFNNHTYNVEIVNEVKPWDNALYQQKTTQTGVVATPVSVNKQMLLDGPFFSPSSDQVKSYANDLNTNADMYSVVGHKELAELATIWSSYSQGFQYAETQTTLWIKPKWLSTWLNTLKHSDHEVRIVGHGVRSGNFDSLATDPRGFDLAMCNMGRARGDGSHGFGIYVSPLDCIPADYTSVSGKHKDGTFVLGLLQVPKPGTTTHTSIASTHTSSNAYQTANGAIEFYHLGSNRTNYLAGPSENDAYNVRDQTLFLALGKVVAK